MAELYRYAAFISYSSKDSAFAKRLHRALESYGIPSSLGKFDLIGGGKSNRIYPVFRDREELAAGHLGDVIEANLRASAALIVVCSPNGAASPWVQKEIEYFASLGRGDKIFAIIADNAPALDAAGNDATPQCFPPAFRGDALSGDKLEPLAADARKSKDGFRNAWLKIVAGMIGVTPGQIVDRDQKRRTRQAIANIAAVMTVIFGVALAFVTVDKWRPGLDRGLAYLRSYQQYGRLVHERATLVAGPTGPNSAFQDCARGSTDCPVMVVLPAGAFMMGEGQDAHPVSIRRFAVSQNDITFADWQACLRAGGCNAYLPDRSGWTGDNRPVIKVSWDDAQHYVDWLSAVTGQHYRLLSEAEWEYAARGVTTLNATHTRYYWGNDLPACDHHAPNGALFGFCPEQKTLPVGSFPPNHFGLYDMAGNVFQWVQDCYAPYDRATHGAVAATDAAATTICSNRVLRGGSWDVDPGNLFSAYRISGIPSDRSNNEIGFRVARTL